MAQEKVTKNFIFHGGILAIAGILVRIIGMVYRIPMAEILKQEGNGIYSAAFNVYNIVLVLSSYGLPMAVSKLVSARISTRQYVNTHRLFKAAIAVSFASGGLAAMIMYFGAGFIERNFYENYPGIAIPLRILAPTIFIVAVLGVFRGFFQGQGTMIPTAVSQIAEQIVNAVVSVVAALWLIRLYKDSVNVSAYAAAGGTLGTCMGALTALLFVGFVYIIYRPVFAKKVRRDTTRFVESYQDIFMVLGITLVPIILGQTFYQISAVIDDIMFGKIMGNAGLLDSEITSFQGNFSSSYVLLTSIPMGVASAMSASMLPSIVASKANHMYAEIKDKIYSTIKANMFIAIPSFVGLTVLGGPLIKLLFPSYNSAQGAMMLKIGAIAVVFYTLSTVTSSALQGIDKMNLPVIHASISLVVHVMILWMMLRFTDLGIYSMVIASTLFPVIVMILNLKALYRFTGYRQELIKTFAMPLGCAVFMGVVSGLVYKVFELMTHNNFISLMFAMITAAGTYFGSIMILKKKRIY